MPMQVAPEQAPMMAYQPQIVYAPTAESYFPQYSQPQIVYAYPEVNNAPM